MGPHFTDKETKASWLVQGPIADEVMELGCDPTFGFSGPVKGGGSHVPGRTTQIKLGVLGEAGIKKDQQS